MSAICWENEELWVPIWCIVSLVVDLCFLRVFHTGIREKSAVHREGVARAGRVEVMWDEFGDLLNAL